MSSRLARGAALVLLGCVSACSHGTESETAPAPDRMLVRRTAFANGQPWSELHYFHGKPAGRWTTWHENGQKASEGEYVDGRMHGRWQHWHVDGGLASDANYREGYLDGQYLECWPNGKPKSQGAYVKGRPEGPWIEFSRKGERLLAGSFKDGEREGVWTGWNPEKGTTRSYVYTHGQLETDPEKKKAALEAAGVK